MAIKIVKLKDAQTATNSDGSVTITGKRDEQSFGQAALTVATMPFKINSDTTYVSESTAAVGSIVSGLTLFHVCDYVHSARGGKPISPITKIFKPGR